MNILVLTNNINPDNGWGRYSSDLISLIRKTKHKVTTLTEVNSNYGDVAVLGRGLKMIKAIIKTRHYLKNCDLIYAIDGYPYAVIAMFANMGLRKRFIITAVGTYSVAPLYNRLTSLWLEVAYKKAHKIIAISNYTKQEILKKIKTVEIEVVNPGIDYNRFFRQRIVSSERFVLSVGSLKNRKGFHISIPAFARVKKEVHDLKYKIVGSYNQAYLNKLKILARRCGVEDAVEFIKNVSDEELGSLYQTAQLFILTSVNENHHFEGYGLVFLEAAAAGLPVIGTLGNGIEDAVEINKNGILVKQNNIEDTASAILRLISDKNLWQAMSLSSYQWARQHDLQKINPELLI